MMPIHEPKRRAVSPTALIDFNAALIDLLERHERSAASFEAPSRRAAKPSPTVCEPAPGSDVAIGDWDVLFCAVKDRLRASAHDRERVAAVVWSHAKLPPLDRLRADVLDCVQALDQLQDTLRHELERRGRSAGATDEAVGGCRCGCLGQDAFDGRQAR